MSNQRLDRSQPNREVRGNRSLERGWDGAREMIGQGLPNCAQRARGVQTLSGEPWDAGDSQTSPLPEGNSAPSSWVSSDLGALEDLGCTRGMVGLGCSEGQGEGLQQKFWGALSDHSCAPSSLLSPETGKRAWDANSPSWPFCPPLAPSSGC